MCKKVFTKNNQSEVRRIGLMNEQRSLIDVTISSKICLPTKAKIYLSWNVVKFWVNKMAREIVRAVPKSVSILLKAHCIPSSLAINKLGAPHNREAWNP